MNTDYNSNEPPSATTYTSKHDHAAHRQLDEADFLKQESAEAKQAMAHTVQELKDSLRTAADLKLWTRQHPWAAVGVAAVAGFAVANAVTPSKHEHAPPPPWMAYGNGQAAPAGAPHAAKSYGALNSLLAPLFDMAKVALQSTIASAIGGAMQQQANEAETPPQPQDVSHDTVTSETSAAL
jgi:ElaB/YqjD/DUF883 family membrane-anchored ribosome-binding protein